MATNTKPPAAGVAIENNPAEPTTFFSRRGVMKGTAGLVGLGALAGMGFWYGTQPALAASTFTEDQNGDVTVTTNAGEVMDVSIAPAFTLNWENFGGGATGFDYDLTATVGGQTATVYSETAVADATGSEVASFTSDSMSDYDGSVTIACEAASIIDGSTITTDSFPTNVAQGASESETVTLSLTPSGTTGIGGASVDAAAATTSFDVIVENPDGTMEVTIDSTNAQATGADSADEASA